MGTSAIPRGGGVGDGKFGFAWVQLTLDESAIPPTLPHLFPSLPDGVMVAPVTLTHLVMVRTHVGQPIGSTNLMTDLAENLGSTKRSEDGAFLRIDRKAIGPEGQPTHVGQPNQVELVGIQAHRRTALVVDFAPT